MIRFFLILTILYQITAQADESGVIYQGKRYVLFKDGKQIAEAPKRSPAGYIDPATGKAQEGLLTQALGFVEDKTNKVICYFAASLQNGDGRNAMEPAPYLSCIKR